MESFICPIEQSNWKIYKAAIAYQNDSKKICDIPLLFSCPMVIDREYGNLCSGISQYFLSYSLLGAEKGEGRYPNELRSTSCHQENDTPFLPVGLNFSVLVTSK